MKNITKVGLSALAGALAFTSVNAGEMSISGSMEGTFTKKGGHSTSSQPLGMDKELSITGSGELDNGVGVAYKQTTTDALAVAIFVASFPKSSIVVDTDFTVVMSLEGTLVFIQPPTRYVKVRVVLLGTCP